MANPEKETRPYIIVGESRVDILMEKVNSFIAEGYEPYGDFKCLVIPGDSENFINTEVRFLQPMMLEE